jgi:hypothetical protein
MSHNALWVSNKTLFPLQHLHFKEKLQEKRRTDECEITAE